MNDDQALAWLARRLALGTSPAHVVRWRGRTVEAVLDELLDPEGHGVVFEPDPWSDLDVPEEISVEAVVPVVDAWLDHLASTARPLEARLTWFWHDFFAVAANQVRTVHSFLDHIELLRSHALGDFAELLRAVTVDPAMLVFLDGTRNARGAINENYGRELLELYSLGVGNYTEADVRAAAVALSGWVWRPEIDDAILLPRRHDPTPQSLLGETVSDLDSVIDTVTAQPACGRHVVGRLALSLLGVLPDESTLNRLGDDFVGGGHDIAHAVRSLVELGLSGVTEPIVLSPVEWLLQTQTITGVTLPDPRARLMLFRQMGQVPGVPPNVGGYPGADTWAGPSAMVGRFRAASVFAALTADESPALDFARRGEWDGLAGLAARPDGFSAETMVALGEADRTRRGGREALAAALMSPEMVIA